MQAQDPELLNDLRKLSGKEDDRRSSSNREDVLASSASRESLDDLRDDSTSAEGVLKEEGISGVFTIFSYVFYF